MEEILQEIRSLSKKLDNLTMGVRNIDRKLGKISTKVEVISSVTVEVVSVLDKLNTNSIRIEDHME